MTALILICAVALDHLLGEPRRWHPLVGFGRWAGRLEAGLNRRSRALGLLAWSLAVLPFVALAWWLSLQLGWWLEVLLGYLALGGTSLARHARDVQAALERGDLPVARERVGWLVSRDSRELDETEVTRAAIESVLENGNDAVFAALFWLAVAGAPGVVLYRLANTLDAMWGYRNDRFERFGWAAARLDDLLNLIPARLTALSYALVGRFMPALRCWRAQGGQWYSPNAGPVMAAGAGALGLKLGGAAVYHGRRKDRPRLGEGRVPQAHDIGRAVALVLRAAWLWLLVALVLSLILEFPHA